MERQTLNLVVDLEVCDHRPMKNDTMALVTATRSRLAVEHVLGTISGLKHSCVKFPC